MHRSPSRSLKLLSVALVAVLTLVAAGCGGDDDAVVLGHHRGQGQRLRVTKAAWVYVGPINDGGWTQAHDDGRKYVEEASSATRSRRPTRRTCPRAPRPRRSSRTSIKDGNQIIFATSFGYGDALAELAEKYPDVKFEHATGAATDENLATYYGAGEDTIYLTGIAAGAAIPERHDRLRRPVPDPRGHPPHQRLHARRAVGRTPTPPPRSCGPTPGSTPTTERQAADSLDRRRRRRHRLRPGQPRHRRGRQGQPSLPFVGLRLGPERELPRHLADRLPLQLGPVLHRAVKAVADGTLGDRPVLRRHRTTASSSLAPFGELGQRRDPDDHRRPSSRPSRRHVRRVRRPAHRPGRRGARCPRARPLELGDHPRPWTGSSPASIGDPAGLTRAASRSACHRRNQSPRVAGASRPGGRRDAGITKRFPGGVVANDAVDFEVARRRGARPAGRERRRQVHASNVLHRPLPAR